MAFRLQLRRLCCPIKPFTLLRSLNFFHKRKPYTKPYLRFLVEKPSKKKMAESTIIVFDFDKTIIECDSDNWVVDELSAAKPGSLKEGKMDFLPF